MLQVWDKLSAEEQALLLQEIGVTIGAENFGAASLQDTVSNSERSDPLFPDDYNG